MTQLPESTIKELQRLKAYFPYRIVWAAYDPVSGNYETGVSKTRRQINDRMRQGHACYTV